MHKTLLIIGILLLIFAGLLYLTTRPKDDNLSDKPQPIPTSIPQSQIFAVESLSPPTAQLMGIAHITPIIVTFTQQVDSSAFDFRTEPQAEIVAQFKDRSVIFRPKQAWSFDQEITLTITSARSSTGVYMSSPYSFTFKAPLPTF